MRTILLLVCLFHITKPVYGQADCYENLYKLNKSTLYAYWDSLLDVNPAQVIDEAGAYYESGERLKDSTICSDAAYYIGMAYDFPYNINELPISWYKLAVGKEPLSIRSSTCKKNAALNLFGLYTFNVQLDTALYWGTKLQVLYNALKDSNKLAYIYHYKSESFLSLFNMDSSKIYKDLSLQMIQNSKQDYQTLSIWAYYLADDTMSVDLKIPILRKILSKHLELTKQTEGYYDPSLENIYTSLARAYLENETYDSTLYYLDLANSNVFANGYFRTNCYMAQKNFEEAEKVLFQMDTTNFQKEQWQYYYKLLYDLYRQKSDAKKTLYYLEKLQSTTESLSMVRIEENTKLAQRNYVLQQQNHQQALAEEQNKLQLKKLQLSIAVIGILLLLALLAAIYFYFRIRQQKMAAQISLFEQEKENIRLKSLIEGENEERSRISQELHDDISGNLSVAKMLAQRSKHSNPALAEDAHYNKMIALMDETYNSVRNIAHSLSTNIITELGLVKSLERYIKLVNAARTDIQFQFFASDVENLAYDNQKLLILYRCVQELIQNTLKHAEASQGKLVLRQNKEGFELELSDNGKGIRMQSQAGIGMGNIRDRIQSIGGTVVWENKDEGVSTTINIS